MSYATQRNSLVRTRQDLVVVGVRECQNHYAALVQQLLTRTEEMDHADWVKTSVTVTANNATAPDGTLTADTVSFNALNDSITQTVTGMSVTDKSFTGSVYLRVASGTKQVSIAVQNVAGSLVGLEQVLVTTTWARYCVSKLFPAPVAGDVVFYIGRAFAGDDVGDLEVWGANLSRNPSDIEAMIPFPYRKRVAEAVGTVSVNVSRCEISDQGDGSRCHYSRPTCQDPGNFNAGNTWENAGAAYISYQPRSSWTANWRGIREFRFCRKNAALPLPGEDIAPLLISFPTAAQEIDAERAVTVNERATFEFEDDASPGAWNLRQSGEGGLTNTQTGVGTFWRRWVAIYRNYDNPEGYVVRKLGYVEPGGVEADFQTRGKYLIRNWEASDRRIRLVCSDRLKLARKQIPAKISDTNKIAVHISAAALTITVDDASEITPVSSDGSYTVTIEIEPDTGSAEKVNVTAIDLTTNVLTVTRGRWGTTARSHPNNAAFRQVAEFGTERSDTTVAALGKNPIDILIELYRYAGLTSAEVDSTTLQAQRDLWLPSSTSPESQAYGPLLRRTVTEITEVEALAREIRELAGIFLWVNDSQQLTGRVFAPKPPGTTPTDLTDDAGFVVGTISIDDNSEARLSRVLIAYGTATDDGGSVEDYSNVRVEIDVDAEEREFYGDDRLKAVLSKWVQASDTFSPEYFTSHLIQRFRHGARILTARLEIKDDDLQLGTFVKVNTDLLQDVHGNALDTVFYVTKKKPAGDSQIEIEALEANLPERVFFWAPDGLPDYTSATAANKEYGYWSDDRGNVGTPAVPAYVWW